MFAGALAVVNFGFKKRSTQRFQTNICDFSEDFKNIVVNAETASIVFVPSEDGICKVVCVETEKQKHSVQIQEDTLPIELTDTRKWYDHIGISFQTPAVTVYLPKEVYTSLTVHTVTRNVELPGGFRFETVSVTGTTADITCYASVSKNAELRTTTGNIALSSIETETVVLSATTGRIQVNHVLCDDLTAKCSTGRISLEGIIATGHVDVRTTTGDVRLESCDSEDLTIKTTTGGVKGTLPRKKCL